MTAPNHREGLNSLITEWETVSECVKRELEHARDLLEAGLITESGLRLGRATEACLYDVASELGITLSDKSIKTLQTIRNTLTQYENEILRDQSSGKILQLAEVSRTLSETIGKLAGDKESRAGTKSKEPKSIRSITQEILRSPIASGPKSRFGKHQQPLLELFRFRNEAAHASPEHKERELQMEEYSEMLSICQDVLRALFAIKLGAMVAPKSDP